ncbi:hypothetical protein AVEN_69373-1, partial [Araneus ventricosus]
FEMFDEFLSRVMSSGRSRCSVFSHFLGWCFDVAQRYLRFVGVPVTGGLP